ncbi:hypothetical protein ACFQWB_16800 [Paenibacillus thermoaerophilus]|uniref:Uncharacterized protein n=1 Tax=Paenibacillus thermoaerophilus TaxID=1215385 RepID=A0ABW2VA95_9BACL
MTMTGSNLHPRKIKSDEDWVHLTYDVIHDDAIDKLMIRYRDQEPKEAAIVETGKGRIWYRFSDTPVNADPEVTRIYKDGTAVTGWY